MNRIYGPGQVIGDVKMSRRWAYWLRGYLRALSEGFAGKEALLRGGRYGGMGGVHCMRDLVIVKKMEVFLQHPDIQQAMRNVYGEVGFELPEAIDLHIQHMRGGFPDKDGHPTPPNYQALKDYITRVTPKEPSRMHVLTARVGPPREPRTDGSPPPMSARPIGDIIEG